jgi:hypothetical protein
MSGVQKERYPQIGVAMTCRSFEEYERMFSCSFKPGESVLDVAAGASSFAAAARKQGIQSVSADPLYGLEPDVMTRRSLQELEEASAKLADMQHIYSWSYYGSASQHEALRRQSLELFLEDYGRLYGTDAYVSAALPRLPFADGSFDRVLCSHFLFLYGEQFGEEFHREAVLELARVVRRGGEVRIYPLLDLKWDPYAGLGELMAFLEGHGLSPALEASSLSFIPGSHQLLVIRKPG